MSKDISEATRRDIIDHFSLRGVSWSGRLSDREFLSRLYDLTELPSHDHRFTNAAGDIGQHAESWNDWEPDWVFSDPRFNLRHCSDEEFLRFLAETLHPVVRQDLAEATALAAVFNQSLRTDGWELVRGEEMAGRPVFRPQRIGSRLEVFKDPTGWPKVDRQLQEAKERLRSARTEEQFQTVGLVCREALITVGQTCFKRDCHRSPDGTDPSNTDAKRLLEAIVDGELGDAANEEARAHAKAAVRLAYALQHKRTADFRMAALCMEATTSVVNILAVLVGRRS